MSEKSDIDREVDDYFQKFVKVPVAPVAPRQEFVKVPVAPAEDQDFDKLENAFRVLGSKEPEPQKKEGRKPVQDVLKLSPEGEQAAAGVVGGYLGSKIKPGAAATFPTQAQREAEGLRRIREALLTQRTYQDVLAEEMSRAGIPSTRTPTTSGEKWAANWAGQERPGVGGVPEASAAYQRSKGQGKTTGRLSKMWGPSGPNEPTALVDRLLDRATRAAEQQTATEAATQRAVRSASQQVASSTPGPLSQLGRALSGPRVSGALGGAGAGLSAYEAYQRYQEGDRSGAVIAALGGLGGAASMIPGLAPVGMGVGLASIPAMYINDILKGKIENPYRPEMMTNVDPMGNPIPGP